MKAIGAMRDRVHVCAPADTRDAGGAVVPADSPETVRYAEVRPLSAREAAIAGQTQGRVSLTVRMRYFAGLTSRHTLKMKNGAAWRTFRIEGVTNPDGKKVEHLVTVTESV